MIAMIFDDWNDGLGRLRASPACFARVPFVLRRGGGCVGMACRGVAGFRFFGGGWYAPFVLRTFPPRASEIRPHCPLASGFRQNDGGLR